MKRRDFVKGLAAATTAGAALAQDKTQQQAKTPPPAPNTANQGSTTTPSNASSPAATAQPQTAAFHTPNIPTTLPDTVATTDTQYFTAVRYATLVHLCEIMMPSSSAYPGALQADTPQFLDFHVGGSPADRQAMYNDGLDRLNADAMRNFNIAFAKTDASQADAVLRPFLKGWITNHPPREKHERFIALAHRDIRTATLNSPLWAQAAEASGERTPGVGLYWAPIDPGIETWVSKGTPKGAAPITQPAHS
jgi:hypothetical protein